MDINLEGADKLLYFTHQYTHQVPCKNNFLVGTAKLAKKHGVSKMVAVCPVEHDLAYSEEETTWVEKRQAAEQEALSVNSKLSVLNTDLVFGPEPSHVVHFMMQCAMAGKIQQPFLSEKASFKPVHQDDLVAAITQVGTRGLTGQWAVRGSQEVTAKQLLNMVEQSCGKQAGQTTASMQLPLLPPFRILEEFFYGIAMDTNMAEMIGHFEEDQEGPVTGKSIWDEIDAKPTEDLDRYFSYNHVVDGDERLLFPTFAGYKMN